MKILDKYDINVDCSNIVSYTLLISINTINYITLQDICYDIVWIYPKACRNNHITIVSLLSDTGVDINDKDKVSSCNIIVFI
jgi:hypothetical protein